MTPAVPRRAALALVAGVAGCAVAPAGAPLPATLLPHGLTAAQAVELYQAARGIAEVAAMVDPAIAPFLAVAVAVCDPLAARVASGKAATDIAALQQAASAVLLRTVALVRVVPAAA